VPAIYLAIISERGAVPWSEAVKQRGMAAELGLPIRLEDELDDIREAQVGFGYERHASLTDIYAHSLIRLVASHAVADDPHRHRKSNSFASSAFGTVAAANLRSAGETCNGVIFIHGKDQRITAWRTCCGPQVVLLSARIVNTSPQVP
jgi:hypothetical protein